MCGPLNDTVLEAVEKSGEQVTTYLILLKLNNYLFKVV